MSFTLFDIIVCAIVTASSITGMYKGLIKVSISFIAFLGSILLTYFLYPFVFDFLTSFFSNKVVLITFSGAIAYLISIIIVGFLSSKFSLIFNNISGGLVDRFLGIFAGGIKGIAICFILFIIIAIFSSESYIKAETADDIAKTTIMDKYPEWLKNSLTVKYFDNAKNKLIAVISEDTMKSIKLHDDTAPTDSLEE